jgi:iron complex outermembrane receptor protein
MTLFPSACWRRPLRVVAILTLVALPMQPVLAQDAAISDTEPDAAAPVSETPADSGTAPYDETVPVNPAAPAEQPAAEGSAEATKLEKVEVTGSRIKRTDYETAQPVTAISRKDIERSGVVTLGELLQALPSAGSALNTTYNNGGTGATEIDLRNLGSSRALVLVNGHRWVNGLRSLSTSSVDLNTIPVAIVERIEVLQDGASAIYGSDAIAGVVNIITRKDYQGAELSVQGGAYTYGGGDGAQQAHSISFGDVFRSAVGHSSLFASLSYQDQRAIPTAARDISSLPKANTGLTRGSGFLPDSRILFVPTPVNGVILGTEKCPGLAADLANPILDDPGAGVGAPLSPGQLPSVPFNIPPGLGEQIPGVQLCDLIHIRGADPSPLYTDYRHYNVPDDNYNYAQDNILTTPLRTYGAFIGFNHKFDTMALDVLPDLGFTFEGLYNYRQSRQQLAPQPTCSGDACPIIGGGLDENGISINQRTFVHADNPYNPFGQDIGRGDAQAGLIGLGAVLFRPTQLGRRVQEQKVPTFYLRPAFVGTLQIGLPFSWEIGYGHGQSIQNEKLFGSIRLDHVLLGLGDPANCTGDCVPLDFLHGGVLTQEMIDYMTFTGVSKTKQIQQDAFANLSTTIDDLWPMGSIGIAAGFEYRRDRYSFTPDMFAQTGISAGLFSAPTSGQVVAKEEFLEINIPLLTDLPMVKELEVSLAGRISHYETFGNSRNGKVGLRYKPYDDLLLRGTYSSSFRAPNVGDLFLGEAQSFPALSDPCVPPVNGGTRTEGSNADTNCAADGVDPNVDQSNLQIVSPFKGNPDLKPETSHSFSAGFVFSPEFVPGLDLAIDVFRIYINDFITAPGGQFILDSCYEAEPNFRQYCERISRGNGGTGEVQLVINTFENVAKFVTGGIDFHVGWLLPTRNLGLEEFGRFKLVTSATFLSSYDQFTRGLDGSITKSGLTGKNLGDNAYPRWKINPSLTWTLGGFEATWTSRIVWHNVESCDDGFDPTLTDLGLCSDPNKLAADGSPDPENELPTIAKHDLQIAYNFAASRLSLALGAQNIFDTDPPVSYSAFANSFDASDYWIPGTLVYARVQKKF